MASPTKRRPLPALSLLLALTLLTALVWWRVLHRDSGQASANTPCPTPSATTDALPRPKSVSVSVLNSTNRAGIAKATAAKLTKLGFAVSGYGNDGPKVHVSGVAEIRFAPDQQKGASLLAYYFPLAKLVPRASEPTGIVVVSLGAKFTAVATSQAVATAMKSAHISLAPAHATASPVPSGSASC
jgi:LytR cell envelope-related transcriptional attenuator